MSNIREKEIFPLGYNSLEGGRESFQVDTGRRKVMRGSGTYCSVSAPCGPPLSCCGPILTGKYRIKMLCAYVYEPLVSDMFLCGAPLVDTPQTSGRYCLCTLDTATNTCYLRCYADTDAAAARVKRKASGYLFSRPSP